MNPKYYYPIFRTVSAFLAAGAMLLPAVASAQVAEAEEVQFLTRGPVHEAFAESVSFEPESGMVISGRPPELIEELPPEQQPEGDNVTWIPGYWAWDEDKNDFIWISGIWRNLPPGRQWVPGYWSDIEDGKSEWTSGYWADATVTEVSYIETPPPSNVDVGPNIEAPSEDHSWIPGNWYWSDSRYLWRPGYWVPQRTNWTWVPSRYSWTRRGYVYVDGYWDYAVARRGVLFAPVYFNDHIYSRPNYYYTPSIVVALNVFSSHLFIRPRCGHYYFGDYYAPRYRDSGYYTSFSWYSGRRGYDPIYAYDRWDHRSDRDWEKRRSDDYHYFRDNEQARPPHTWAAMKSHREDRYADGRNRNYASSFSDFTKDSKDGHRFRKVDDERRKQFVSQRQDMRKFSEERSRTESRSKKTREESGKVPSREKLTRSPIIGREVEKFAENEAPPKRPETRGGKASIKERLEARDSVKNQARDASKRPSNPNERRTEGGENSSGNERAEKEKAESTRPSRGEDADKSERRKPSSIKDADRKQSERKSSEREVKPSDQQREGLSKPEDSPVPDRKEGSIPKREDRPSNTQRESRAKPETRVAPERKEESAPKREVRPNIPQRESRSKPEARVAPERKEETAPKREVRPSIPQRESRPKPETRPVPERREQVVPQREVRPSVPQREARPVPERREQAAPRREAQPAPQSRPTPRPESSRVPSRIDEGKRSTTEEELKREKGMKR